MPPLPVYKLNYYGVRGQTLSWIESFLRDRKQHVLVEGAKSDEAEVTSGVPQGTVLAPFCSWPLSTTFPQSWIPKLDCLQMIVCCFAKLTTYTTQTNYRRTSRHLKNGSLTGRCPFTPRNAPPFECPARNGLLTPKISKTNLVLS